MGLKEHSRTPHKPKSPNAVWLIVCEGRNKTEKTYLGNFISKLRGSDIALLIKSSEDTSPKGMIKKALELAKTNDIKTTRNSKDRIICLMDTDLSDERIKIISELKSKYPSVEILLSTPCFETWFMLHFKKCPVRYSSSENTKKGLKKYIQNYEESMDVYRSVPQIKQNTNVAIANAQTIRKNLENKQINLYSIDANPYTDIDLLIKDILSHQVD